MLLALTAKGVKPSQIQNPTFFLQWRKREIKEKLEVYQMNGQLNIPFSP